MQDKGTDGLAKGGQARSCGACGLAQPILDAQTMNDGKKGTTENFHDLFSEEEVCTVLYILYCRVDESRTEDQTGLVLARPGPWNEWKDGLLQIARGHYAMERERDK